jgi:electron transport complex protein RnfB
MTTDPYKQLALALDRLPGGFPETKSGVELQILRKIFSPEEASLASVLTGRSETIDTIAQRVDRPREEVELRLLGMLGRMLVWSSLRGPVPRFRLAPFVVGFWPTS